jgi:hypothetical protein
MPRGGGRGRCWGGGRGWDYPVSPPPWTEEDERQALAAEAADAEARLQAIQQRLAQLERANPEEV